MGYLSTILLSLTCEKNRPCKPSMSTALRTHLLSHSTGPPTTFLHR